MQLPDITLPALGAAAVNPDPQIKLPQSEKTDASEADQKRLHRRQVHRDWVKRNQSHRREYMRQYASKHKEFRASENLKWCREHQEKRRATRRKSYWKHREKILVKNKIYRIKNRASLCQRVREYVSRNREVIRQKMHTYHKLVYYPKNRDRIILQTSEYAKKHPEVRAKAALNWKKRHPEKYRAQIRAAHVNRKARMRGAMVADTNVSKIIRRWRLQKSFVCYYCNGRFHTEQMHVDHVVPIARGGKHSSDNICRSCATCNIRKRHKPVNSIVSNGQSFLSL